MEGEMVGCKDENSLPHSFGSRPWLFVMHGTRKKTCTFFDPINNSMEERILPEFFQGKACLGCYGEWILFSNELTRECFFLNTISFSKIYIPPPSDSLDFISGTVSISSPPNTSNCVVVLICSSKTFLLVFSLGTTSWNKVPINYLNENMSSLMGASVIHNERLFALTSRDETLAIDVPSLARGCVEMTVINRLKLCPMPYYWFVFLVKCAGDLFSIALHSYGRGQLVTHVEVRRLELSSKGCNEMHWRRVQDIGGHTFFLSGNYGGSLPANMAWGAQCNCIYFPMNCGDGMRLYKFCLDDQILNYTFLPENNAGLERLLWAFPTNIMQTLEEDSLNSFGVAETKETDSTIIGKDDENKMVISRRWDELQIDLLELLLPRLSLVDCLQFASVCKEWSYASSSVQKGKVWPWLMHLPNFKYRSCKFFDPFYCKEYALKSDALDAQDHLALRFSKGGWVVITEGNHRVFILNPFTAQVINLPSLDNYIFDGIPFMSLPASPDFVVYGFFFQMYGEYVVISSWRPGEEEWVSHEFRSSSPFFPSSNNPVLFQGEFYCLGRKGELGVFNPEMESWNVLCKPEPVHLAVPWYGDEYCHLLELNGELISVFREDDIKKPIHLFKLNQSEMVWKKVEHLGNMTLFVDRRNSIAIPALEKKYVNRIYIPKFEGNKDSKKVIFYSMEDNRYHPCVQTHTVEEPVTCVWMEPNLHLHKS